MPTRLFRMFFNLSRTQGYKENYEGFDFSNCPDLVPLLSGNNLKLARCKGAIFQGQVLSNMDMTGSDLRGANFRDAVISNCNLSSCLIGGADFTGASLVNVKLKNTIGLPIGLDHDLAKKTSKVPVDFARSATQLMRFVRIPRINFDDLPVKEILLILHFFVLPTLTISFSIVHAIKEEQVAREKVEQAASYRVPSPSRGVIFALQPGLGFRVNDFVINFLEGVNKNQNMVSVLPDYVLNGKSTVMTNSVFPPEEIKTALLSGKYEGGVVEGDTKVYDVEGDGNVYSGLTKVLALANQQSAEGTKVVIVIFVNLGLLLDGGYAPEEVVRGFREFSNNGGTVIVVAAEEYPYSYSDKLEQFGRSLSAKLIIKQDLVEDNDRHAAFVRLKKVLNAEGFNVR